MRLTFPCVSTPKINKMPIVNLDHSNPETLSKEVFNISGIEAKTDLTGLQIEAVSKLKTYARLTGLTMLDIHINEMLILNKSKDRASMREFVEALKSLKENTIQKKGESFKLLG